MQRFRPAPPSPESPLRPPGRSAPAGRRRPGGSRRLTPHRLTLADAPYGVLPQIPRMHAAVRPGIISPVPAWLAGVPVPRAGWGRRPRTTTSRNGRSSDPSAELPAVSRISDGVEEAGVGRLACGHHENGDLWRTAHSCRSTNARWISDRTREVNATCSLKRAEERER